ncbi:MAG TPA: LytTR family DNA-binding domain-containing protein [Gammaproteobacteria bacterium]|nr:LytTR family DNA-binding domain-containing protein [Gammaproteobacteria bacterium]
MKVLIADDEPLARERLRALLAEVGGVEVAGEAANGLEVIERVNDACPDIVLMDIRMPALDGLEAARHLAGLPVRPPAVIFTTACGDHALAAFEANAVDYLLKPIRRERLALALERAQTLNRGRMSALAAGRRRTHLGTVVKGRLQLIPMEDVVYLQADQKYVTVACKDGRDVLIDESLKSLESEFSDLFLRIHRNTLVAIAYVAGLEKEGENETVMRMRHRTERLPVSRRHLGEARARLRHPGKL